MPYQGSLLVEDDEFELEAELLIVRDEEVAFELSGSDVDGPFSVEGVARRTSSGSYMSERLPVPYTEYRYGDEAVILLSRVEETQERCKIEGQWRRGGEHWSFSGLLETFDAWYLRTPHQFCVHRTPIQDRAPPRA